MNINYDYLDIDKSYNIINYLNNININTYDKIKNIFRHSNKLKVIKFYIDYLSIKGIDIKKQINKIDENKDSLLTISIKHNKKPSIVNYILDYTKKNTINILDNYGYSVLMYILEKKDVDNFIDIINKILYKTTNFNIFNNDKKSLLYLAIISNISNKDYKNNIIHIIKNNIDFYTLNTLDIYDNSTLNVALKYHKSIDINIIKYIFKNTFYSIINKVNNSGNSTLIYAIKNMNNNNDVEVKLIKQIMDKTSKKTINIVNNKNRSVLIYSLIYIGGIPICSQIFDKTNDKTINIIDNKKKSALIYCIKYETHLTEKIIDRVDNNIFDEKDKDDLIILDHVLKNTVNIPEDIIIKILDKTNIKLMSNFEKVRLLIIAIRNSSEIIVTNILNRFNIKKTINKLYSKNGYSSYTKSVLYESIQNEMPSSIIMRILENTNDNIIRDDNIFNEFCVNNLSSNFEIRMQIFNRTSEEHKNCMFEKALQNKNCYDNRYIRFFVQMGYNMSYVNINKVHKNNKIYRKYVYKRMYLILLCVSRIKFSKFSACIFDKYLWSKIFNIDICNNLKRSLENKNVSLSKRQKR